MMELPLTPARLANLVRDAVPQPPADPQQQNLSNTAPVVAIGAFDGVHLGHRELISAAVAEAHAWGVPAVVVTFDPDPSEVLAGPKAEHRLLSVSDRVAFCYRLGADRVVTLPFTQELASQEPAAFVRDLSVRLGGLASIHVGSNFHFGHAGAGSVDTLRQLGERMGFAVVEHELLRKDYETVSSTRIRELLAEGRVEDAATLLGRYHYVRGTVAHGRGEGTSFGFPTANVCCDGGCCMPCEGVYACVVTDGRTAWPAAANVGAPPTFSEHREAFLEANLIGFEGDLYDRELAVVFLAWLRGSRKFSSVEELERVVLGNIAWVRNNIGAACVEVSA